jgi:hypothetical protein
VAAGSAVVAVNKEEEAATANHAARAGSKKAVQLARVAESVAPPAVLNQSCVPLHVVAAAAVIQVRQQQTAAPTRTAGEETGPLLRPTSAPAAQRVYAPEGAAEARVRETAQARNVAEQRTRLSPLKAPPPLKGAESAPWVGAVRVEATAAAAKWHAELLQKGTKQKSTAAS